MFLICLTLAGCARRTNKNSKLVNNMSEYNKIVKKTQSSRGNENPPFDYRLVYSPLDDGYRYDLIIQNASKTMKHIKALAYSDALNDKYYPTLGIFEEARYNLKKDYVNKKEGYYKGFALSGKVKREGELRLYLSYENENKRVSEVYRIHYEN